MAVSTDFMMMFVLVLIAITVAFFVFEWCKSRKRKSLSAPHLKLLNDSNADVRAQAAQTLGNIGHTSSVPHLIEALGDSATSVREAAVGALAKIGDQTSLGSLVHLAIHDDLPSVRIAAVEALETIGKKYIRYMDVGSRLMSARTSQHAAELQKSIDTYITPALMLALKDEDASVQEACVSALQRIGESKILEDITKKQEEGQADTVEFSAFYLPEVRSGQRYHISVYAHLQGHKTDVESDIKRVSEWLEDKFFRSKTARHSTKLRQNTLITIFPESHKIQFDPVSITKRWNGKSTRFKFSFEPSEVLDGETIVVRASIQVEGIEVACIKFSFEVLNRRLQPPIEEIMNPLAAAKSNSQTTELYQKIFISYSRHDKEVIEAYRFAQLAIGNDIFMDTYSIRSGEDWRAALANAIDTADVFQLFWSKDSAVSANVRDEWDYALKYRCPQNNCVDFIRPVYWVNPIPVPPPDELKHLNFKYVPLREHFKRGK